MGRWLGSNPSSWLVVVLVTARLTLFTPSPYAHSALARALLLPHTFPRHSSLRESWVSSPCAPFSSHSSHKVWPPPRRAGEKVKAGNAFSCCYAGGHREGNTSACSVFWFEQRKYKRDVDCKTALLSIYIVDSNFIPPREITGKLILGSDQTTHGEKCLCMAELRHKGGWWFLQTCSRIKMFR